MSDWLTNLAALLDAQAVPPLDVALVAGVNLFIGQYPNDFPASTMGVMLTATAGPPGDNERNISFPRVQITCRCASYLQAWKQALAIDAFLDGARCIVQGNASTGTAWHHIRGLQSPFGIGLDEKFCHRIVCNYQFDVLPNP